MGQTYVIHANIFYSLNIIYLYLKPYIYIHGHNVTICSQYILIKYKINFLWNVYKVTTNVYV